MAEKKFDYNAMDAQGTMLQPLRASKLDIEKYCEYEAALLEKTKNFGTAMKVLRYTEDSGYRRCFPMAVMI